MSIEKLKTLRNILRTVPKHGCKRVVELGTGQAALTILLKNLFDHVYTVEKSSKSYSDNLAKFELQSFNGVDAFNEDSRDFLKAVLTNDIFCHENTLFYIDSHYCEGSIKNAVGQYDLPIWEELALIRDHMEAPHFIVIDDVHTFGVVRPDTFGDWHRVTKESILEFMGLDSVSLHGELNDHFFMWRKPNVKAS